MSSTSVLWNRLEKVWEPPDFLVFFQTYSKRPPHEMKKGTLLFNEGDPLGRLYFIKKGFIKLYRLTEEGRDGTTYLLGPGNIIGLRALLSEDESAKHHAQAITDVTIITISRKEYFNAMEQHPEFLVDLMHAYIERLDYTEQKLVGFMFTDATARVAHFLLNCFVRFGKKEGKKLILPLPLTHQLIADFVGAFRETVSLAIKKLEQKNIIMVKKGQITILDLKKLKLFASGFEKI